MAKTQGRIVYSANYSNSWAITIGINEYTNASPLSYACNDAEAFASLLVDKFEFPATNVTTLLNADATRANIHSSIHSLIKNTNENDRVIIFYAGHGYTLPAHGKEAGFLVPVDGDTADTSTLLPWDDLVSTSHIIGAKHILFIMDACYGGLIGMRALAPGTTRFVRNMMTRYTRQFFTAGKADEVVADAGGPRLGHSVFTGHLLEALDGAMPTEDGIISTNSLMAYVYDRVARDSHSRQAPHYGYLAGDGDMFFAVPSLDDDPEMPTDSDNILVEVPIGLSAPDDIVKPQPLRDMMEEYLAEPKHRIKLHNLIKSELRKVQERLGKADFSVQAMQISGEDFAERLRNYEDAVSTFLQVPILLGRWANTDQQTNVHQVVHDLAGNIEVTGGNTLWLALRSYPMLLSMYAGGIAAIQGNNYESLLSLFTTQVKNNNSSDKTTAIQATVKAMLDVNRTNAFKCIPEFKAKHVPQSEYLFARLQPYIEDTLAVGDRYEDLFDRFEVLYALSHVDHARRPWGPPGRFAWKYCRPSTTNPFMDAVEEAMKYADAWPPIAAGLFDGSSKRFIDVAKEYENEILRDLTWF